MKRILLHILFWVCYAAQVFLVEYLWGKATLPQFTDSQIIVIAIKCALIYPFPKIFFCYFVAYYVMDRIIRRQGYLFFHILTILAALFVTILFDRLLTNYIVLPYVYEGAIATMPLLEGRRVLIVLLYTGFASGTMIAIKSVRNQLAAKEREKNLVKEKLETELKFLRNQVNPHFLFNTLNNIYALTRKKSDKAPEVVMKLSELLSFMLYESGKESITLAEEIKILEDYIELERIRYNERLSIEFHKDLDDTSQPIAPLLLLPLVENAFKHGVSETRFDSFVRINMQLKNAQFRFHIENTVPNGKTVNGSHNIGLNNTRRQLELMYKHHEFRVNPQPTSFSVEMNINLDSYGKT
jgi:LytS/YehU family sensor histidine kinase